MGADGRLAGKQLLGRAREIAFVGDLHEGPELIEFHGFLAGFLMWIY
jgi:hypothetical protein